MTTDFTKIKCFGEDCILITIREHSKEPVLILTEREIRELNKEWGKKE
jgi:hypothetical protein